MFHLKKKKPLYQIFIREGLVSQVQNLLTHASNVLATLDKLQRRACVVTPAVIDDTTNSHLRGAMIHDVEQTIAQIRKFM